jgi:hypothetical protein
MSRGIDRPPTLPEYLIDQDFLPQSEGAWFDRATGHAIIRVVCGPEEETQLIALAPHGASLYKAMFYAGTPDAVIIAAVEAALTLSRPEPAARSGPARQRSAQPGRPVLRKE